MPYKHKVRGSNPLSPTMNSKTSSDGGLFVLEDLLGFEPRESQTALWAVCGQAVREPEQTYTFATRIFLRTQNLVYAAHQAAL